MLRKPVIVPVAMTGALPVGLVPVDMPPPPQATTRAAAAARKMAGSDLFMTLTSSEWLCCSSGCLRPGFRFGGDPAVIPVWDSLSLGGSAIYETRCLI